jgi:hypothetical protein
VVKAGSPALKPVILLAKLRGASMKFKADEYTSAGITRRQVIGGGLSTLFTSIVSPDIWSESSTPRAQLRSVNVMNFIRAEEPREPMDLVLPVREQMKAIKANNLPATWLLQYDALVEGPFVDFLKAEMPPGHEVGIWFEMNRRICDDAGVEWRGKPDWEWDYHVPTAYAIGYSPDERRKLADAAMTTFKRVFGREAKAIASWNLDAVTIAHLSDHYAIEAFGNCRDQLATDGFTIWGAPIAAYYPCRNNAWSPALVARNQIATPMFRLLGQDPVYYYDKSLPYPDTIEPVWPSGRSRIFVDRFLNMIAHAPTQRVAYAQLGQENSFGWPEMREAYAMQMEALARIRNEGTVVVETMGATGRRFKAAFASTPVQAQVMLEDPFGKDNPSERTIWYQSKYYRANLHFRGNEFYLRDIHVYNDLFVQPYLTTPVRQHGIEQRMLAVLDGYHWSDDEVHAGRAGVRARGRFVTMGQADSPTTLETSGLPVVSEHGGELHASIPLSQGNSLLCIFREREICFKLQGNSSSRSKLSLLFEWMPERSSLVEVSKDRLKYRFRDFDYSVRILNGVASPTSEGVKIVAANSKTLCLAMDQGMNI